MLDIERKEKIYGGFMTEQLRKMVRPLSVQPMKLTPLITRREVFEINDGPMPTREQQEHFRKNRDKVIKKYLIPQLKKTGNVLHGAQSRNMLIEDDVGKEKAKKMG